MSTCACQLDFVISWQKGTRGYLDYQDALNRKLTDSFAPIFAPTNSRFNLVYLSILEAAKYAVACELKVRENERTTLLTRRFRETEYFGSAVDFNGQAVRYAERAQGLLRDLPASLRELSPPDDGVLAEARTAMFQSLVKFNTTQGDFGEVVGIWDEVAKRARDGGGGALLSRLGEDLRSFTQLRTQGDRGNAPHSPLPWWKYVVIALIVGASVFGIIACFVWSACVWVWPAISALAPWVFGMIDRGC